MIDAVIPVDLSRRPIDLLRRLKRLLPALRAQGLGVVVGHNERRTVFDRLLKKLCARENARLVSGQFYDHAVNNALLRNKAIAAVDAPLAVLLDADLYVPPSTIPAVARRVHAGEVPFSVLPCLYLSRKGSSRLVGGKESPTRLFESYLAYRRASYLHMALPSSVTVFRTGDFAAAGAFDERFTGHGYEDLDFLVRLGWLHAVVPRSQSLLVDLPSQAPLLATGFRSYLARLALPALLNGEIAFHLWHSTSRDAYYGARADNAKHFESKLFREIRPTIARDHTAVDQADFDIELIQAYLDICRTYKKNPRDYTVLFDNRPGHVDRLDTLGRKLRFLMNAY